MEKKKNNGKKVAMVITTYNQEELLIKFLDSLLKKTDYSNYKIYFIDDSGKGEIGAKIRKKFSSIDVTINKENLGCSKSYNYGMKKAIRKYNPNYLLLLNDDMEISDKLWLNKLIDFAEKKEDGGIFGCQIVYPDKSLQWYAKKGKPYLSEHPGKFSEDPEILKTQEVSNIMGAVLLIKKEVIDEIGLLDEEFSPFYAEESDFCFRASKRGFKIFYVGDIKVIHHKGKSISKLTKEDVWFIKKRNSIRLEWKHYGFLKIIYYTIIHFGSIFKRDKISKFIKLKLLISAYIYNFKKIKEIRKLR